MELAGADHRTIPRWYAGRAGGLAKAVEADRFSDVDERGEHELPAATEAFLARQCSNRLHLWLGDEPCPRAFRGRAAACERLGRRGLLLTKFANQVPTPLPAGVIHVAYAPFSELLPQCAALVHHGGIGTTAQALAAGVPQLIVPFAHDQHDNAARVSGSGAAHVGAKGVSEGERGEGTSGLIG